MDTIQKSIQQGCIHIQFNGCTPFSYDKFERNCIEEIVLDKKNDYSVGPMIGGDRMNKSNFPSSKYRNFWQLAFIPEDLRVAPANIKDPLQRQAWTANNVANMFVNDNHGPITMGRFLKKMQDNNKDSLLMSDTRNWTVLMYIGGDYFQKVNHGYLIEDIPDESINDMVIITDNDTINWSSDVILVDELLPNEHLLFESKMLHKFDQAWKDQTSTKHYSHEKPPFQSDPVK